MSSVTTAPAAEHRSSKLLALAGLVVMLALLGATSVGWFGPNPVGQSSQDTAPLLIPPGPAFSIWGPIYSGLIVFVVLQLVKARTNSDLWIPLRRLAAINMVLNGLWLVVTSYDMLWTSVVIIIGMLYTLFRINRLFAQLAIEGVGHSFWGERLVFGVYFAWVTLATALNVTGALYFYNWGGFGWPAENWTVVITVIVAAIAGYTAVKFRSPAYALVVVWAFGWLGIRHYQENALLATLSLVVVVLFTVLTVILLGGWTKRSLTPPHHDRPDVQLR